jgi:hypothetical protein
MDYKGNISREQSQRSLEIPTSNEIRTSDQTPHAIMFWKSPTMISPSAANCWTAWRKLVNRGPKRRWPPTFPDAWRSISAVSCITSLGSGGELRDWDRKASFCSLERSASNCETACASLISGFSCKTFASRADMGGDVGKGFE